MLQKFYAMLQKTDIKAFKLRVAMVSAKTGAPIVEGPAAGNGQSTAPELFESTVPSASQSVVAQPQESSKQQSVEAAAVSNSDQVSASQTNGQPSRANTINSQIVDQAVSSKID